MQEERYIWLIHQQLRGDLSPAEKEELHRWVEASSGNRVLADRITTAWKMSADYPELPPVNLDDEFSALQNRLNTGTTPSRMRILHTRRWMAAAATFLLLIGFTGLWKWFAAAEPEWKEVYADTAVREIDLDDGTRVFLHPGSRLSVPVSAFSGHRPVRLEGEAFFDVAEDPNAPFQITTSQTRVTVLGTRFNVEAYPTKPVTTVTVASGKVRLESLDGNRKIVLTANQRGSYRSTSSELVRETTTNLNELSWMRGNLEFRNTKLSEVLADMEASFNISIRLENQELVDCPITGRFLLGNGPEALLERLESFMQIQWKEEQKNSFVIREGKCPQ